MITTFRAGPPKTDESVREIPISFDLMRRLHEHRTLQKRQAADLDREWSTTNLVFPNQSGGWLDRSKVGRRLLEDCKRALVKPITSHGLRHTGGSLVAQEKWDPETIRQRMGHADVMTTMRVYVHSNDVQAKRMADAIGDFFTRPAGDQSEAM